MAESISLIEAARAGGLDVTACVYPYDFWATTLGSFRFDLGWRERYGITFEDRSSRIANPDGSVVFEAKDLWPEAGGKRDRVFLDLWESYLEPL